MASGGKDWRTRNAYCAVRGWGGYCCEKYAIAWTGGMAAQHSTCVNSGISALMFFSVTRYWENDLVKVIKKEICLQLRPMETLTCLLELTG